MTAPDREEMLAAVSRLANELSACADKPRRYDLIAGALIKPAELDALRALLTASREDAETIWRLEGERDAAQCGYDISIEWWGERDKERLATIAAQAAEIARLTARVAEVTDALKRTQWGYHGDCPVCSADVLEGHSTVCTVGKALADE